MKALVFTSLYPNASMPLNAVFVRRRMEAWAAMPGHEMTVVAPVPWFPRLPVRTRADWARFATVPRHESPWGYDIHHPRYLLTPKVGMRWYGRSMQAATIALAQQLHARHHFDLIDAHYVFPDGEAAIAIGRQLGLPVVLSSRGTDLNLYPDLPHIRPRIQRTLRATDELICVCSELAQVAQSLGMPADRLSIIGNGIDPGLFHPRDAAEARRSLRLSMPGPVLLSVGHLTERKGFHVLIEALARIWAAPGGLAAAPTLVIVGDGPQRAELETLVARLGMGGKVVLAGSRSPGELPSYYAAADLFLLASSREGWPNVLCEAQAMGVPAVASHAWGIGEVVSDESVGLLVQQRSADAFDQAIRRALTLRWDRAHIAQRGSRRTWPQVATEVDTVFERALARASRNCRAGDAA